MPRSVCFVLLCVLAAGCVAEIGDGNGGEDDYVAFGDPPGLVCTPTPSGAAYAQNLTREAAWNDGTDTVDVYDLDTCALEHSIAHPEGGGAGDQFGAAIAMSDPVYPPHEFDLEGHLWVSAPEREYKRCSNAFCSLFCPSLCASKYYGLVYGMRLDGLDSEYGPLSSVIDNPIKKAHTGFGAALAIDDMLLVIGSPGNKRAYVLTGPTNEVVTLSGAGVAGPFSHSDGDYYALTGSGASFGKAIEIEYFPAEPISSTTNLITRRVVVDSDAGATCFELTGEQDSYDPATDARYPLMPFSWNVAACAD